MKIIMTLKALMICAVFPFLLIACKKDDENENQGANNRLKQLSYKYADSDMEGTTAFQYNTNGQLISTLNKWSEDGVQQSEAVTYTYSGNEVYTSTARDTRYIYKIVNKRRESVTRIDYGDYGWFDDNGEMLEVDSMDIRTEYIYNGDLLVESNDYIYGKKNTSRTFSYENNRLKSIVEQFSFYYQEEKFTYSGDKISRIDYYIRGIEGIPGENHSILTYSGDNLVKWVDYKDGEAIYTIDITYSNNLITSVVERSADGQLFSEEIRVYENGSSNVGPLLFDPYFNHLQKGLFTGRKNTDRKTSNYLKYIVYAGLNR